MRSRILEVPALWLAVLTPACGDSGSDEGDAETTAAATETGADASVGEGTLTTSATVDTSASTSASTEGSSSEGEASTTEGTTGEPVACVPVTERALTVPEAMVRHVAPAWAGDGLGIAWGDARHGETELYFGRFDAAGDPSAAEARLTDAQGESGLPAVVADDDGFAIAWTDERNGPEVMWRRVADDGSAVGDEVVLGPGGGFPALAWTGTDHGVAWGGPADGDNEIFFARVGDGADPPNRISFAMGGSFLPALAWDGGQFGLAWQDTRAAGSGIYVTRVAQDGTELGDESWLTSPEGGGGASVTFTGEAFLVGWSRAVMNGTYRSVHARLVDGAGAPQGEEMLLIPDGTIQAAVAWNATGEIGVVAHATVDGVGTATTEIVFARFDASGTAIGERVQVSDGLLVPQDEAAWPRIVAADDGFALTWTDQRDGQGAAWYARVCP